MSITLLHDWESSIEKNKNNTEELLKIAEDIYNTAYARGKASTERPQGEFNLEDFKRFVESKIDMQDLYLPTHFFMLLDAYLDMRGNENETNN